MKKILFSLVIASFLILSTNASFDGGYTNVSGDRNFSKNSGVDELRVSEDYFINPFSSSNIKRNVTVCTGNNCPCGPSGCSFTTSYSVDGQLFGPSHPKFKSANQTRRNWYNYSDGIDSRVVYLENTYTRPDGIYTPDQTVKVRRYYITTYRHDTSTPTCGEVNYYNDEALTESFTYAGGWLNSPKYFTMTCLDNETDCYCAPDDESCIMRDGKVISTAQLLGHKINPQVSFTNKVKLTDTSCEPGGAFQQVLFDLKTPKFDISLGGESFNLNNLTLRNYKVQDGKAFDGIQTPGIVEFTRSGSINQIAGNTTIDLEIEDSFLEDSVHGVSGIKSYDFTITRETSTSFEPVSSENIESCAQTYAAATEYNTTGNIEVSDTRNISFNCNELTTAGKYKFLFLATDWAGNSTKVSTVVNIYPNQISTATSTLNILNQDSIIYANNEDSYNYEIIFRDQYGNPVFDRLITEPTQTNEGYNLEKTILLPNSSTALRYLYPMNKTDLYGKYLFSVKSLFPGEMTHRFKLNYDFWNDQYIQTGSPLDLVMGGLNNGEFKKPFSANLVLIGPGSKIELGTQQEYQINLSYTGSVSETSSQSLNITTDTVRFSTPHEFPSLESIDNTFTEDNLQCSFEGTFDSKDSISVLRTPVIDINSMEVSYTLAGQNIVYPLSSFGLSGCDEVSTVGLKTIGSTQGDGRGEITGGSENFSDISTSQLRSDIRKNAYSLIRGMNSNQTVNGVRYVEGDTTISGNVGYETLIVKNGNVFISGNLNSAGNSLGIIVLKDDGYDISSDFNIKGNIYVANTVSSINAHLYADGTLRSANSLGDEYLDGDLGTKLRMKGSLFTRNTVGGGIQAGDGNYILPGGSTTLNRELASIYDLNYIRRAQECGDTDDYSFLVEYDSSIQLNPPKGFTTGN